MSKILKKNIQILFLVKLASEFCGRYILDVCVQAYFVLYTTVVGFVSQLIVIYMLTRAQTIYISMIL